MDLNGIFKLEELRGKISNTSIDNYNELRKLAQEVKSVLETNPDLANKYYNSNDDLATLLKPYLQNYVQNNQVQTYNEQTRTM